MLYTTSWVITGASSIPIEGRVYLRKEDAQQALDTIQTQLESEGRARWPLVLAERTLVIAFGITDTKVSPESVHDMLTYEGP